MTDMITNILILECAIQIHDFHIFTHFFILHGFITHPQNDQFPGGFLVQLIEHCIGVAEAVGSTAVQRYDFHVFTLINIWC